MIRYPQNYPSRPDVQTWRPYQMKSGNPTLNPTKPTALFGIVPSEPNTYSVYNVVPDKIETLLENIYGLLKKKHSVKGKGQTPGNRTTPDDGQNPGANNGGGSGPGFGGGPPGSGGGPPGLARLPKTKGDDDDEFHDALDYEFAEGSNIKIKQHPMNVVEIDPTSTFSEGTSPSIVPRSYDLGRFGITMDRHVNELNSALSDGLESIKLRYEAVVYGASSLKELDAIQADHRANKVLEPAWDPLEEIRNRLGVFVGQVRRASVAMDIEPPELAGAVASFDFDDIKKAIAKIDTATNSRRASTVSNSSYSPGASMSLDSPTAAPGVSAVSNISSGRSLNSSSSSGAPMSLDSPTAAPGVWHPPTEFAVSSNSLAPPHIRRTVYPGRRMTNLRIDTGLPAKKKDKKELVGSRIGTKNTGRPTKNTSDKNNTEYFNKVMDRTTGKMKR